MTIKFIVYAVTVIFTYILGLISKKLKWNDFYFDWNINPC